jgi:sugar/nucleoside kinase (ribokinase family)
VVVPALAVPQLVDPIGAGDAFCAGFIGARLDGLDVETALRWGAGCGAASVSVEGDSEGAPTRDELLHALHGGPDTVR